MLQRKPLRLLAAAVTALWIAACSPAPAPPQQHPPRPGVQVQMRVVDPDGHGTFHWQGRDLALREPALATSGDIIDVSAVLDPAYPALNIRFAPAPAARLARATESLVGKQVAVTVDDHVLTVATVQGPFGESMQVRDPAATVAEVRDMARHITHGGAPPRPR